MVIGFAAIGAAALVLPRDLELLVGIYAFGALLAFTIAHVSVIALRFREPDLPRGYMVPLSVTVKGAKVPLPSVLGALLAGAGWVTVLVFHSGAAGSARPGCSAAWCCMWSTARASRSRCCAG